MQLWLLPLCVEILTVEVLLNITLVLQGITAWAQQHCQLHRTHLLVTDVLPDHTVQSAPLITFTALTARTPTSLVLVRATFVLKATTVSEDLLLIRVFLVCS